MAKTHPKTLYRNTQNQKVAGVCSGIAEYFDVDPTLIRLAWVLLTFLSWGTLILAYIIAWIIIPPKQS
jgi:phage shock protein PspC (stress-responsive transcriptional regulator)